MISNIGVAYGLGGIFSVDSLVWSCVPPNKTNVRQEIVSRANPRVWQRYVSRSVGISIGVLGWYYSNSSGRDIYL